jgi:hypothetical protein
MSRPPGAQDEHEDRDEDPVLDDLIEKEVKRASAPYEGVWPAEILEETRRLHRIALRTHPDLRELLDNLRPSVSVERSDKVATARWRASAKSDSKKAGGAS